MPSPCTSMRPVNGIESGTVRMVRTCSKYRGYQCGVQYAEGFIPCRAYPRMPVNGLLP